MAAGQLHSDCIGNASAGQEVASKKESLPVPGTTLDPALLSRLLLCHYASLVRSLDKWDSSVPLQAAAQALQLHTILRSAHTLHSSPTLWFHHHMDCWQPDIVPPYSYNTPGFSGHCLDHTYAD